MIITFIAPPAAGKGTLSIKVSQKWNIPHISTGDLLRNVEDENVKQKLSEGKFISDNIVISLLEKRIKESDAKNGYILDGFPRNLNQAKMYETLLQKLNLNQGIVIILDLDKEMAAKRITHRKVCPNCGAIYNDMFESTKPKVKNICDNCQNNLIKRSDDNMKTFEDRYQTYLNETYPLVKYYENKGIAYHVKCMDNLDDTFIEVKKIIGVLYDKH